MLEFYDLGTAIDDCCDWERTPRLTEDFLGSLEDARIPVVDALALQFLPGEAFGGAFSAGTLFITSASGATAKLSGVEQEILHSYLWSRTHILSSNARLRAKYPHAVKD